MQSTDAQLVAEVTHALREKLQEYRRAYGPLAKVMGTDINQWTLNLLEAMPPAIELLKQELQGKTENEKKS